MGDARHVKRAFECLRDVTHEVTLQHGKDGMVARATGEGVRVQVCFLRALEYAPLRCSVAVATETMARLLRTATSEQRVRLEVEERAVRFEMFTEQRTTRYLVPTMDAQPVREMPEMERLCVLTMRTEHMRSLLRDVRHAGDRVAIEVCSGALLLVGKADNAHGEVVSSEVHVDGAEGCYGVYSSGLMCHFLKAQHVANVLTLVLYGSRLRMVLEAELRLTLELDELGGHL